MADQIAPEERPTNTETTRVSPRMSEQLPVRDAVAGVPVEVEEELTNLVLETLNAIQKRADDRVSTAL